MKVRGAFFFVGYVCITIIVYALLCAFRLVCMPSAFNPSSCGLSLPCGPVSKVIWKTPLLYRLFFDFLGWQGLFVAACATGLGIFAARFIKNRNARSFAKGA